jgi:hypothetical protein
MLSLVRRCAISFDVLADIKEDGAKEGDDIEEAA